jgi:hypothetical protein
MQRTPALTPVLLLTLIQAACFSPAPPQIEVETVVSNLNNPAFVSVASDGEVLVCDAGPGRDGGNGRVLSVRDGRARELLGGLPTEFWKRGADGEPDRFKLGPLGALRLAHGELLVANSGLADGVDHLLLLDAEARPGSGRASNAVAPTSDDPADKGEGNLTGLSLATDGTVHVAGQGADAKSWVLTFDPATGELSPRLSADAHGIEVNSPMMTLPWGDGLLVLYSGAGGAADGTLVLWDLESGAPRARWSLPGLLDPMGMARIPGTDALAVVDNNWALREVRAGRLARVELPTGGGEAQVELLLEDLLGPTSCTFDRDGRLLVTLLGESFDADRGSLIAVAGVR